MKITRLYRKNKTLYVAKIVFWTLFLLALFLLSQVFFPVKSNLINPLIDSYNVKAYGPPTKLVTPLDFMEEAARIYGVNKYLMHCLITHESGWRADAKNPKSTAFGYGQFINSTWISWRNQMGEDARLELRSNPQEAFLTMAWALDKGYRYHWEANRYCRNLSLRPQ